MGLSAGRVVGIGRASAAGVIAPSSDQSEV